MKIAGKKISLSTQIFTMMLLGAIVGLLLKDVMIKLEFIGTIWLNLIKMIVVPMILFTIITGIVSQKNLKTLGRIAIRIMIFYLCTTIIASIVGLAVGSIVRPGVWADISGLEAKEISGATDMTIGNFFLSMFSSNMIKTFAESNILQTLIIAILLGVAIVRIKNEETKERLRNLFESLNQMNNSLIGMIMIVSPIGVFFLMAASFAKYGLAIFSSMMALAGTYYLACLAHVIITYGLTMWFVCKINPFSFLKRSVELWVYTLSTCSSVASIPVNIKVAKEKFNVPETISGFTIPLGSQMNYDGSVVLYACVILFISQLTGIPISLPTLIKVIFLSAIFSTGGGGIPGSGIVKLLVMVQAFGLPTEVVGIIAAFYRLFDMGTTTLNCLGDLTGTVLVSKLEGYDVRKQIREEA